MSAILKALKKLESDSNRHLTWRINVRSIGEKPSRVKGFLLLGMVISLALLSYASGIIDIRISPGGIHAFVSSIFEGYLSQTKEADRKPISRQDSATSPQSNQGMQTSPGARITDRKDSLLQSDRLSGGHTHSQHVQLRMEALKKMRSAQFGKDEPKPEMLNAHTLHVSAPPIKRTHPLNRVTPTKNLIGKDASTLPRLNDPTITLQAIAWAQDPTQRITVINGQILREGESLSGITIDGIREDQVIIRKGIKSMALVFRNK
jgi:hypothetical protein